MEVWASFCAAGGNVRATSLGGIAMARRGRPPKHVWGEDTLADVRRAVEDVTLARPKKLVEQDGVKFLRPLKRGELKKGRLGS